MKLFFGDFSNLKRFKNTFCSVHVIWECIYKSQTFDFKEFCAKRFGFEKYFGGRLKKKKIQCEMKPHKTTFF